MIATMPINLDWMSSPEPPKITPFQRLIRDLNWAETDLGPMSTWCRELRQVVRFMITDTAPIILYYGPRQTIIYNEAHVPLVGQNHPSMLGRNALDVFPEFWHMFENVIAEQRQTGVTASGEASLLLMERHGFLEETYFDWKLIPIIGDDGTYLGGYGVPTEHTKRVIGERRRLCVQKLSTHVAQAMSFDALWKSTISGLAENEKDVPFALLLAHENSLQFSGVGNGHGYKVVESIGLPHCHKLNNIEIDITSGTDHLTMAIREAVEQSRITLISGDDPLIAEHMRGLEWKGTGIASTQFILMPIRAGTNTPAVLLLGLNPYRRYNPWYEEFLQNVMDCLAAQLSQIQLLEEVKYRAKLQEKAVQRSEQSEMRFARFAALPIVGLAVADPYGVITYANDFWCSFSGVDPAKVVGTHWQDYVFEDDLPTLGQWWEKVAVLKQSASFQFRSTNSYKNGHMEMPQRTGFAACYAEFDENDKVKSVMGLVIDISEQKWIEAQLLQRSRELEASEQRYRSFADLCPFGIVSTDVDGYVQIGNDSWHDFYGFKKGEVKDPQPWLPHIHDDDMKKVKDYFKDLQTTPGPHTVMVRLKQKYTIFEGERVLENDAWILATGMQEYNADGSVHHIDFWVVDVSAQKMAEKVLTEKMEEAIRNRTQQERFIDMISHEIRNPLSAVLHCGEEIIDSLKQSLINLSSVASGGPMAMRRGPNSTKTQKLLHSALDSANTIMYCVQHQKQIVDDVLTLSKLDSELLVVSPIPVKLTDIVSSAVKIFDPELRMSDITLNLVEHDSIEQHGVDWLLLDPNRFLQIVINLITNAIKFTRACETRNIKLMISTHKERPCHFEEIDFVPRRYSPMERKGSLVQASDEDEASQIYLRVSVSDTGKGLSAKQKALLFNRFAQASPKTEVEYGGSGLGLFISRQITEILGGEIGVGTSPSGGCTFAFYVTTSKIDPPQSYRIQTIPNPLSTRTMSAPVTLLPTKANLKQQDVKIHISEVTLKRKILVVEDNVINQKVLCKQLRNRGFEVDASNHGKEALSALEKAHASDEYYTVVLCDIEMPVMDGIQCVKEIRMRETDNRLPSHLPVIGVTANVRSQQVDAAIQAGMDGVTTKPYRIDDLIANIDRWCPP